jgi:hypothetical protein
VFVKPFEKKKSKLLQTAPFARKIQAVEVLSLHSKPAGCEELKA